MKEEKELLESLVKSIIAYNEAHPENVTCVPLEEAEPALVDFWKSLKQSADHLNITLPWSIE